jgi:opacity protein-like surface antigen
MKKFVATCCIAFLVSTSAHATGFFVGADALHANSEKTAKNSNPTSGSINGIKKEDDNRINYGLNAGFRLDCKLDCGNLYQSVELFYDNLNFGSSRFASPNAVSDHVKLQNRYGAKVNVGFEITPKIIPFLTAGLTNVSYHNNGSSDNINFSRHQLTPIYGVGLLVDMDKNLSLKVAYDYQKFDIPSAQAGAKVQTSLGVAKVGLVYNFSL